MNNCLICFNLLVVVILLLSSRVNAEPEVKAVDFLSWEKVKLITDQAEYLNVELDGFIQFRGETAYPEVRLWESSEAMKFQRPFKSISINSESISSILLENNKSPLLRWKELNGMYVRIRGIFKDQEKGYDYIDLGKYIKVYDVTIMMKNGKEVCLKQPSSFNEHPGADKPTSPE